ncbi:MAG: DnaA/Hda family protein [Rickettsiales bacterium]
MSTSSQLPLSLSFPEVFSEASFYVSNCNSLAYDTLISENNWQAHALYIYGESGCGKTHLCHIWAQRTNAIFIPIERIKAETINSNCIVENIEKCSDEKSLFHLFNHCRDIGKKLLMTSIVPQTSLDFTLPDLTSRLKACQSVAINPPDDELLRGVIRKQFSDRQLMVSDEVISYITTRTERTLSNIKSLIEKIDKASISEQKNITIPFMKKLLEG